MKVFLFFLLILPTGITSAQHYQGSRAASMGKASITNTDAWSVFSNIGGISAVEEVSLLAGFENRFQFEPFNTYTAGFIYPQKFLTTAVSFLRFGDELFNKQEVGIGIGNKFGLARLGAKVNYVQYSIEGYGSRSLWVLEFGGVAELTHHLSIGASIYNLNQAKFSEYMDERLPVIVRAGLSYKPINKIILNIEIEKDIEFDPSVKAGLEYEVVARVFLRSGVSTQPVATFAGLGFHGKFLQVDYALSNHQVLGLSHSVSLLAYLRKK